jgi:hypothetical protein
MSGLNRILCGSAKPKSSKNEFIFVSQSDEEFLSAAKGDLAPQKFAPHFATAQHLPIQTKGHVSFRKPRFSQGSAQKKFPQFLPGYLHAALPHQFSQNH